MSTLFLVTSCGRQRMEEPTPVADTESKPTQIISTAVPPLVLVDTELLNRDDLTAECDHPEDATFICQSVDTAPKLDVAIHAGTYARWSLNWDQDTTPLTGYETFTLRANRTGNVKPNLYLIDASNRRIATRLAALGLKDGQNTIHIPLAEIRDDDGHKPDFASVRAVQIVFEWDDMAGSLTLESMRFDSIWRESAWREPARTASAESAAELSVPDGFQIEPIAADLQQITQIDHTAEGDLLVSLQDGRVWWYTDTNKDGQYDQRHLYASGLKEVVGLLYDPADGAIWLGGRGQLYRTVDMDNNGVADQYELRIDGLAWGRHQNNGLVWNPIPDPFTGEAERHWIYFGLGSTGDLEIGEDYNATVLRFPRDGQGQESLEIVSRGNRNPYALAWGQVDPPTVQDGQENATDAENEGKRETEAEWQLFASENGPDFNDDPDEVSHIRWQHHYGFPQKFGVSFDEPKTELEGLPYSGSLYNVTPHASASGLIYINNPEWPAAYRTLYVSLFGQVFSEGIVGHTVDRIALSPVDSPTGITYRGEPTNFVVGLNRPLPLGADPTGNMLIGDYATGVIYRVSFVNE